MTPTLKRTAGDGGFQIVNPVTGSEDFPAFTKEIPGLFYFPGVAPKGAARGGQPLILARRSHRSPTTDFGATSAAPPRAACSSREFTPAA